MHAVSTAPSARTAVFWAYTSAFFLSCVLRSANASLDGRLRDAYALDDSTAGFLSSLFFLAFAATQLPLGYLIDRIGPRRAQIAVLPLAVAGLVATAWASGLAVLAAGRALLGVGFAISLMASLCANRAWFPVASLAAVNGAAIGIGSAGAAFAGAPLAALASALGWSGLHLALAATTALVLVAIAALPPDARDSEPRVGEHGRLLQVLRHPLFVRIAPLAALAQGSYLAWLGYWIHPWLRTVAGYDDAGASLGLSLAASTMVAGYLLTGPVVRLLARRGRSLEECAILGILAFAACGVVLAALPRTLALPMWTLYGFCGALNVVAFSVLSASLPQAIQGAAVTLLNLLIFVTGFVVQACLGPAIAAFVAGGGTASTAHRLSMLVVGAGLLVLIALWRRLHAAERTRLARVEAVPAPNRCSAD